MGQPQEIGGRDWDERRRRREAYLATTPYLPAPLLDSERIVKELAGLGVSLLGDTCTILEVIPDGSGDLRRIAHAGANDALTRRSLEDVADLPPRIPPMGELGDALRSGSARIVEYSKHPPTAGEAPVMERVRRFGLASSLIAPLVGRGNRAVGAFIAHRIPPAPPFDDRDVAVAEHLARHAVMALDAGLLLRDSQVARAEAERALEREAFRARVGETLAGSIDYQTTLDSVAQLAVPRLGHICSLLELLDDGSQDLRFVSVGAADPALLQRCRDALHALPDRLPARLSVGEALRLRRSITSRASELPSTDNPWFTMVQEMGIRHVLMVPLVVAERALGAMVLCSIDEARSYSGDDVSLAEDLGRRAAMALDSARLYRAEKAARAASERALRREAFLARVGELLAGSIDYQATLEHITQLAIPVLGDACALLEIDESTGTLRGLTSSVSQKAAAQGYPGNAPPVPLAAAPMLGRLQSEDRPLVIQYDAEQRAHSQYLSRLWDFGCRSTVVAPLRAASRTTGILVLHAFDPGRSYQEDDLSLIQELARRASLALENARLYQAEKAARAASERALQREAFLARVGEVLSGSIDLEATAEQVARLAVPLLGDICVVILHDEGSGSWRRIASAAADRHIQRTLIELRAMEPRAPGFATLEAVLRSGRGAIVPRIDDAGLQQASTSPTHLALLRDLGMREAMMVPLVARGHALGVLVFSARVERRYGDDDLRIAEDLGRRAGVAIDNARLYQREQTARSASERALHREAFLAQAGEIFARSMEYEAIAEQVARLAVPELGDVASVLELMDASAGTLRSIGRAALSPSRLASFPEELLSATQHGPILRVLASGRAEVIEHSADLRRQSEMFRSLWAQGFHRTLVVPLLARGRSVGFLTVQTSRDSRIYSEHDLSLADELGRRAAMALDNARLYQAASAARDEAERSLRALEESERWMRAIVDNSSAVIWLKDREGRYLLLNQTYERMFGIRAQDYLGKTSMDVFGPEVGGALSKNDRKVFETGRAIQTEEPIATRGGRVWLANKFPIPGPDGQVRGIGGIATDITERKQLAAELQQAQKMEAVGRLAGGVAHDFNNLLTVLTGYCESLLAALPAGAGARTYAEQLFQAVGRARALTGRLLTFSRKQPSIQETFDLNGLVSGMAALLGRLLGEDVTLDLSLACGPAMVFASPSDIEQVVLNLAINARDAMPQGGRLTIETAIAASGDAPARVELRVRDTGMGLTPDVRRHIFEPFFTTKEAGRGTGLGLSTTKEVLEACGGSIRADGEAGRGAVFEVTLPLAPAPGSRTPSAHPAEGGDETILVVEDDPDVLDYVRDSLQARGYQVVTAHDPQGALHLGASYPGRIHLLLSDVVMPQMNGREMAARLGALRPGLRVLHMSGYTGDALSRHEIDTTALLLKPFTRDALLRKVRDVLDRAVAR